MLSNAIAAILNNCLIFEQHCQLCGQRPCAGGVCDACVAALASPAATRCPVCAAAAASSLVPCGHCLRRPPAFARLHAAYGYDYPLDGLIGACKYGRQPALQGALASLLRQQLQSTHERPEIDLVVAVPLAPARLAERGFNLPDALAQAVAATIGGRIAHDLCVRKRNTAPQAALDRRQRLRNVRDAFCVKRRCDGLSIAIVDDVATTGATLDALAKALQKAGAKRVEAWVLARASDHKI